MSMSDFLGPRAASKLEPDPMENTTENTTERTNPSRATPTQTRRKLRPKR